MAPLGAVPFCAGMDVAVEAERGRSAGSQLSPTAFLLPASFLNIGHLAFASILGKALGDLLSQKKLIIPFCLPISLPLYMGSFNIFFN